jgi:hypothetical protein
LLGFLLVVERPCSHQFPPEDAAPSTARNPMQILGAEQALGADPHHATPTTHAA